MLLKEPTDRFYRGSSSLLIFFILRKKVLLLHVDLDSDIRGVDGEGSDGTVINGDIASILALYTVRPVTGVALAVLEVVDVDLVDILYLDKGAHGGVTQLTVTPGLPIQL